jgi:glucose-6-phosphate 1-dehydrogenase
VSKSNIVLILIGATGDLARKKLLPALYHLVAENLIPPLYIVGAALEEATPATIMEATKPFLKKFDETQFQHFVKNFSYCPVNLAHPEDFKKLAACVQDVQHKGYENRIVYCAVPATLYGPITEQVAAADIIWREPKKTTPWCRVVYEKPFGQDAPSAHALNQTIARYLDERQIYRVDHYLGKDIIGSIALLRFTNRIFEPLWNYNHVAWVEIDLSETVGIDYRGSYYDSFGALKDVVQNHMLQILALIAMESPKLLQGNYIRDQKAQVLKHTRFVDGFLGQYRGYLQEKKVKQNSTTETFAALKLEINNKRWHGVPFYLKTGKCLQKRETKVIVQFKEVDCLLAQRCPSDPDYLLIQITPEAEFKLAVNVKKPGLALEVERVLMSFYYEHHFSPGAVSGYEAVLEEVALGEQAISVRFDEIEYAWGIIDAIEKRKLPLFIYEQGSQGPEELTEFAKRNKMRWHI